MSYKINDTIVIGDDAKVNVSCMGAGTANANTALFGDGNWKTITATALSTQKLPITLNAGTTTLVTASNGYLSVGTNTGSTIQVLVGAY